VKADSFLASLKEGIIFRLERISDCSFKRKYFLDVILESPVRRVLFKNEG